MFVKSKSDEILHHNNTISRLKKELEDHQREAYGLEAKKDSVAQAAAERLREIGQVCSRPCIAAPASAQQGA